MVGAEKGVGRSCIVDEDHRSVFRGDGNVGRFFFSVLSQSHMSAIEKSISLRERAHENSNDSTDSTQRSNYFKILLKMYRRVLTDRSNFDSHQSNTFELLHVGNIL